MVLSIGNALRGQLQQIDNKSIETVLFGKKDGGKESLLALLFGVE